MKERLERVRNREGPRAPGAVPATPADRVLSLQRQVGNKATAKAVAEPLPDMYVEVELPKHGKTIIPVESFGGLSDSRPGAKDATFSSPTGAYSQELLDHALRGVPIKSLKVHMSKGTTKVVYTFTNVYVTNYTVSDAPHQGAPVDNWTISYDGMSVDYGKPAATADKPK